MRTISSYRLQYISNSSGVPLLIDLCQTYGAVEAYRALLELAAPSRIAPILPCHNPACEVIGASILFKCPGGERIICVSNYCTPVSIILQRAQHTKTSTRAGRVRGGEDKESETDDEEQVEKKLLEMEREELEKMGIPKHLIDMMLAEEEEEL